MHNVMDNMREMNNTFRQELSTEIEMTTFNSTGSCFQVVWRKTIIIRDSMIICTLL